MGVAGAAALALALVLPSLGRPVDDAWISLRYASNLADGLGLVWAPTQPIEGYSNLLWTLLVASGLALGAPLLPWVWAFALSSTAGTVLATAALARRLGGTPWAAACAALLVATSAMLRPWMGTGLETPLVALLLTTGLWASVAAPRRPMSALPWGLLAISRPEGAAFLFVPILAWLGPPSRWRGEVASHPTPGDPGRADGRPLLWALLLLGPLLAQLVHRVVMYGSLLPNTYTAKVDLSTGLFRVDGLRYLLAAVSYDPLLTATICVGAALALRRSPWLGLAVLPVLPASLLVYVSDGDSFGELRLLAPIVPGLAALAMAGLAPEASGAGGPARAFRSLRLAAAAAVALATSGFEASIVQIARVPRFEVATPLAAPWTRLQLRSDGGPDAAYFPGFSWPRLEVGWYLRVLAERLPIGGTFVFEDIGFASYTLRDATLLDARGLTWPAAARFARLDLSPTVDVRAMPEAQAFVEAFLAEDPALVFLTCPDEGFKSPPERALLPDPRFAQRWRLAARGPYLGGNGRVCLYERAGFVPAGPEAAVARYTRMATELPEVQDWQALLDAAARGADPAGPWRVSPDGTPAPTGEVAPPNLGAAAPGEHIRGAGEGEEARQRRIRARQQQRGL